MFDKVLKNERLLEAAGRIVPGKTVRLSGVWGSSAPLLAAALGRLTGRPVLFVTGHLDDADEAADDIEVFTGRHAQLFPAWEVDIGTEHVNDEVFGERVRVCNLLSQGAYKHQEKHRRDVREGRDARATQEEHRRDVPEGRDACGTQKEHRRDVPEGRDACGTESVDVLVAPVMALLQPVPSPEALAAGRRTLRCGARLDPEDLIGWLVDAGFERVDQVDRQGEFARRGGIVDVLPPGATQAVRVEFFADLIESVRRFDLDTQRSTDELDVYDVTAVPGTLQSDPHKNTRLMSYLDPETIVCTIEPAEVMDLAAELFRRLAEDTEQRATPGLCDPEEVFLELAGFPMVEMHTFKPSERASAVELGIQSLQKLDVNTHEALVELTQLSEHADVWVYCENPAERQRFEELLSASHPQFAPRVHTAIGHVHSGFYWPSQRLAAVGHHEVFRRYAKVRRIRRVRAGRPVESLLDLAEGDNVVHLAHGIAKFEGLRTLEREGLSEEYLTLRFADNAVLHVPSAHINLIQKYVGTHRRHPTLSKLGGAGWTRQKQRVSEAVRDLAAEMLRVQALRESAPGVSFPNDTDWQKQFADEFLYTETEDQISATAQIDDDMVRARPMDRLLCGDVGYGKTELAMRAAFKVAETGRQVAVLVPTTVLAAQHYRTFTERLADYPFEVEVISRFRTHSQQAKILERLREGKIDILIGTHRLLSGDVAFPDIGLVVIDEEQRFGVEHKEHLKKVRASVDVLTMTATPIPRTLHMALLGLRDISSLSTPPLDRRSIHTEVCHYDDRLIRQAIHRELNRQGQTFFVHNRVQSIRSVADHVRSLVPDARLAVAHGQMPEGKLEKTMLRFVRREIDVLVCTTIIESGLDIPTANTIIIDNADRFGLAELHQLRGRVGRYKHKAYCYLLLPRTRPVSPVASKRLKAIEEFSDLGAGFQIAMRDLEIRGAGNILGSEQSGHIAAVGYELYCRLLERAVKRLRGEPVPSRRDVHVELGVEAYIPRSYIPSQRQRMEIYRRMARCDSAAELEQLGADLCDAYGRIGPAVRTLLDLAEIRIRASEARIDSIIRMDPDIILTVRDMPATRRIFEGAAGTARFPDGKTLHWRPPPTYLEMPTLVRVLLKQLRPVRAGV